MATTLERNTPMTAAEEVCMKEAEIATMKAELRGAFTRIEELKCFSTDIQNLALSLNGFSAKITEQMVQMSSDMHDLKLTVSSMQNRDGETWRKVKWVVFATIVTAVITGVVTYFLASINIV